MEKFSKWRDPGTGIQPFLPPIAPSGGSALTLILATPFKFVTALARVLLLLPIVAVHLLLVQFLGAGLGFVPFLGASLLGLITSVTTRLALLVLGYGWIETEQLGPKRGGKAVSQISNGSPKRQDLIIANWTSYVDVLYLAFRYNPTFILPVFEELPEPTIQLTGRHTGTGSANLSSALPVSSGPQPTLLGYVSIPLLGMLARTGSLPPNGNIKPTYRTLRDARRKSPGPVVLLPEGTTSNGRALLKFGEGVLADGDVASGDIPGRVWVKFFKHPAPTELTASATCSIPRPINHLLQLLATPLPLPTRTMTVRTLHPSASPSSPSFLPSEILAAAPGGLATTSSAWREACAIVLAETGRVRRVGGMGWVEKAAFLSFWQSRR